MKHIAAGGCTLVKRDLAQPQSGNDVKTSHNKYYKMDALY